MSMMTRAGVEVAVALAAVLAAGAASAANPWGADYFPNVPLTTQDGKTVRFYDDLLKGKSVAINVIFTTCTDVCPLETANLVQLTKLLGDRVGKDVRLYSISIDPKRDTPEVLKAYAEKFGAGGPGWLFLTGKAEDIKLITKKLALIRDRDNPTGRETVDEHDYVPHIRPIREETRKRRPGRRKPRRWVVERTLAWLSKCRAILVRYDKHASNYLGLIQLACALLWYRRYWRLTRKCVLR